MKLVIRTAALTAFCLTAPAGCRYDPPTLGTLAAHDALSSGDSASNREAARPDSPGGVEPMGPRTSPPAISIPDAAALPPDAAALAADAAAPDRAADARTDCAPEQCNGRDDDCDGVIDDGCPIDGALLVTEGARASSPIFGSLTLDRNLPLSHRCPPGQAIVAFTGNSGYAIDSIGVVCASLRVREDRGAMPFRYPLAVEPGQTFDPIGGTSGGGINNATRCPPGFVVSGISAWPTRPATVCPVSYCATVVSAPECPSNFGLEILCSRYQIEGGPGSFRLAALNEPPFRTAARVEVDLGPFGFPASKAEYGCPAQQLVVEAAGSYGPWPYDCARTTVNGLRVACTSPTVRMR
jgi:hypothetical protein